MSQKNIINKFPVILFLMVVLTGSIMWKKTLVNAANVSTGSALSGIQGTWIAFGDYKNAGLYDKNESEFASNADTYFKKLKKDGINTVYFHTVPCDDAIYPSKYLSWSQYMFKTAPDYDPLEILIETAHKYKISFHAWLNPYRKKHKIYDPGKASSTRRILNIIKEIIQNYDVDGIHFDDYFYPTYVQKAQLYNIPIAKRKKVINKMVKKVYKIIKNYDENLLFGISPAGNIEYAQSIGCDLKTWLSKDNYMDYIVPQIYWTDQYMMNGKITKLFTNRLNKWMSLNENDTPMYIGLGLCFAGSHSSKDLGWGQKNNNIVTQIKQLKRKGCDGFILFNSASLYSSTAKKEAKNYRNYINFQ